MTPRRSFLSVRSVRRAVYQLLNPEKRIKATFGAEPSTLAVWGARLDLFIMALIVLSVAAVILESVESVRTAYAPWFYWFEAGAVLVFTVEYAGRLWSCTLNPDYDDGWRGRLQWARSPLALIDLFAILPFFLPFLGIDGRFLRVLRLMRIARLAKLRRYLRSLQLFANVWRSKRHEIIMTSALMFLLLLISASLMYYAERYVQPDTFGSIPHSMWWAVATLTTVGYGDVTPITGLGRVMAACVAIIGIGLFALPTSILGSGFVEEIAKERKAAVRNHNKETAPTYTCPHCGEALTVSLRDAHQDSTSPEESNGRSGSRSPD